MKYVGIVGSRAKFWTHMKRGLVLKLIRNALKKEMNVVYGGHGESYSDPRSITLVSGGCPFGGVDEWAEIIAQLLDVPMAIYKPKENNRASYFERNMQIAKRSDVLYCFNPSERQKGGGTMTLGQAENLGKKTHMVYV